VEPDVKASAEEALDVAVKLAQSKLQKKLAIWILHPICWRQLPPSLPTGTNLGDRWAERKRVEWILGGPSSRVKRVGQRYFLVRVRRVLYSPFVFVTF
jgi:hypothetical protein